jgi:hypothetical protein
VGRTPRRSDRAGAHPDGLERVALVAGHNTAGFTISGKTLAVLEELIPELYPIRGPEIETPFEQNAQVYTDFVFGCSAALLANYSKKRAAELDT